MVSMNSGYDTACRCAGLVTFYRPERGYLANVATWRNAVGALYVVDNSPVFDEAFGRELESAFPGVEILSRGRNLGLARALNLGIEAARRDGCGWLLTMDQDSSFGPGQLRRYFDACLGMERSGVAILSPSHAAGGTDTSPCTFEEVDIAWTSGNLLDVEVAARLGMFDEKLFIDSVDHEYCLRARTNGYRILQSTNCHLDHQLGDSHAVGVRGRKRRVFHSPKRLYFIIRNNLCLADLYGGRFGSFTGRLGRESRRELVTALKYSPRRFEYLSFAFRAWRDYRKGVFGNPVDL